MASKQSQRKPKLYTFRQYLETFAPESLAEWSGNHARNVAAVQHKHITMITTSLLKYAVGQRKVTTLRDTEPCPQCGNAREFTIISQRCSEDCCEVWARCKCGWEPPSGDRLEDVWGGTSNNYCNAAIHCWNDTIRNLKPEATQ